MDTQVTTQKTTQKTVQEIIQDTVDELEENACCHELESSDDSSIVFDYSNFFDSYPEFEDQLALETENLLGLTSELKQAGFSGWLYVNNFSVEIREQ